MLAVESVDGGAQPGMPCSQIAVPGRQTRGPGMAWRWAEEVPG